MPVGKNALKRVANNGYSKVATTAPDMENSTVEEVKTPEKKPEKAAPVVKKAASKPAKKAEKKLPEAQSTRPDGFVKVSFGAPLPVHLL